jgi:hypothetical protein
MTASASAKTNAYFRIVLMHRSLSSMRRAAGQVASQREQNACGVYLPDLEQLRAPDKPLGMVRLRLVKNTSLGWQRNVARSNDLVAWM